MNEPVYLLVWLAGLFGLLGCVLAGVARLVRRDTTEHDRRYVWRTIKWPPEEDSSNPSPEHREGSFRQEPPNH